MEQEPTMRDVMEALSQINRRFDRVDAKFEAIDHRFDGVESRLDTLDETVEFIKDNAVVDRFVVLHQTLDVELVALRSRCERMEHFMLQVAQRLDLHFEPT